MNPYINDILSQPAALGTALEYYPVERLESLRSRVQKGDFDRTVLTRNNHHLYGTDLPRLS